jgi:hypothetical protein
MPSGTNITRGTKPPPLVVQGDGFRFRPCQVSPQQRSCNGPIPLNPPPLRPEPEIFSPLYVMSLNDPTNPPTWNSPDIALYSPMVYAGGTWQTSGGVFPYFVSNPTASLSNLSNVDAINVTVNISYGLVGIGFPPIPLMTQVITIPAQAGIGSNPKTSISLPAAQAWPALLSAYPDVPIAVSALAIYVDLYHPYDSNPNDNYGAMNASNPVVSLVGTGGLSAFINLNNSTGAPLAFNLAVIGANPIGATLAPARYVLAPNSAQVVPVQFPAQPPGTNADITIFATDDGGNPLGGYTARCYFD